MNIRVEKPWHNRRYRYYSVKVYIDGVGPYIVHLDDEDLHTRGSYWGLKSIPPAVLEEARAAAAKAKAEEETHA